MRRFFAPSSCPAARKWTPRRFRFARLAAVLFFIFLPVSLLSAAPRLPRPGGRGYLPGEVLVKYQPGREVAGRGMASALGRPRSVARAGFDRIFLASGRSVEDAVRTLSAYPEVEWAQPNYQYRALDCVPADPYYDDDGQGWIWRMIHAPAAWGLLGTCVTAPGGAAITVAVLDSGVDATHPDLAGCLVPGYNEVGNNSNTSDDEGHGTFISGLIASAWNGAGMAGLSGGVKILPIKVLDSAGYGSTSDITAGVLDAVAMHAKILNMSFGGDGMGVAEKNAYDTALSAGCVLVAAAGNEGTTVLCPAAYPPVVAVGGVDSTGLPVSWSNSGDNLDLVAPCGAGYAPYVPTEDVFSAVWTGSSTVDYPRKTAAWPGNQADSRYGTNVGTSFSVPLVSAAAALVWTLYPSMSRDDVVAHLLFTADPIEGPGWHPASGWGLLNVAGAFTPVVPTPTATPTPTFTHTPTVTLTFTATHTPTVTLTFTPTSTPAPKSPSEPMLVPNPYRPERDGAARIFLPRSASKIAVSLYDAAGQRICRRIYGPSDLQVSASAPWKESFLLHWEACSAGGRFPASGIYILVVELDGRRYRRNVLIIRGRT